MMDIKRINSKKHEEFTGQPNELVLENARRIADAGANLIIRVPVIPMFNHTKAEIRAIASFVKTLHDAKEIHLLPYHRLGIDKYKTLGRNYELSHIESIRCGIYE
jgi:Pyruvate-formate lyase-activating enzyme